MTVGIELGSMYDEIGASSFLHCFFSTVAGNLEPDDWGSRFPVLMTKLYQGEIRVEAVLGNVDVDRLSRVTFIGEEVKRKPLQRNTTGIRFPLSQPLAPARQPDHSSFDDAPQPMSIVGYM